jgi:putative DNA primase/helicase
MSTKARRGIRTKPDSGSVTPKTGVTGVTGVTALNNKEKPGYTDDVTRCNPRNPGDEADPIGAAIDPVTTPPDEENIVVEKPPGVAECPCWRVYLDWWGVGKPRRRPGVYYHGRRESEEGAERIDEWLCGPLLIEATTFDRRGESFGRLLRFRDSTGRWHEWNMPMGLLAGDGADLRRELLHMGLEIDPKHRAKLPHYLMHKAPKRRVLAALSLGWHDGAFVLPDEVIGDAEIRFQSESASPPDFEQRGDLAGWRSEVAGRAIGNPILTLAISAAWSGPLLDLAHVEHAGLHIYGDSSHGKTTAVQAAVSVWGGRALVRSWRATANGLEAAAAESNDSLLALDEINQAPGREIGSIIYQLANGQGKARANVKGGSRRRASWRTVVLSSGEKTIEAYMVAEGGRYMAGQDVRLVNLPIGQRKHGVFDHLHGAIDGRAFADQLKGATKHHHGLASPAFVRWLVANTQNDIGAAIEAIAATMAPNGGQEARVAQQLALIATAGELATEAGLSGWPSGSATKAAVDAFTVWRDHRGQSSAEDQQILDSVRSFIERHGETRFTNRLNPSQHGTRDRAGFIEEDHESGHVRYLFHSQGFREAINGHDRARAITALMGAGWLRCEDPAKAASVRKVEGRAQRVYIVALPDEGDEELMRECA